MGGLSGLFEGVKDTFLGGAEKKAGKQAAAGQKEAAGYYNDLMPRAETRFAPYQAAGSNAMSDYLAGIKQPSTPLPTFNYSGAQPTFSYGGNVPDYSYSGEIPQYTNQVGSFQFDPSQLEKDPGYQFRLQQGIQAVNRGAGQSGMLTSGNRLTALNDYAQGAASQELDNAFNRALQTYNTNYNTGVTDYGLARDRETDQYNRGLTSYDIARTNEATNYGRAQDQYTRDTTQEQTAYDRALQSYELAYGKNSDEYLRAQNYLSQLAQLSQMGFDTSQLLTQLDLNATTGRANARIGQGAAQAAGTLGQYGAIRGTIGDVASGVSGVSAQGGLSNILSGFL